MCVRARVSVCARARECVRVKTFLVLSPSISDDSVFLRDGGMDRGTNRRTYDQKDGQTLIQRFEEALQNSDKGPSKYHIRIMYTAKTFAMEYQDKGLSLSKFSRYFVLIIFLGNVNIPSSSDIPWLAS